MRFEGEYLNDIEWFENIYDYSGDIDIILKNNINGTVAVYFENRNLCFEDEYLNWKKIEKEKNMIMMAN